MNPVADVKSRGKKLAEKARAIIAGTAWLRQISFVLALIAIGMAVVLTILVLINLNAGSYYRAGLFALHGVLSLVVVSAWADNEPLDIKMAFGISVVVLLVDLYTAAWETSRVIQCSNLAPVTAVDQQICLGEPSLQNTVVFFAWGFTVIALLHTIICFVWFSRLREAAEAKAGCAAAAIEAKFMASNARVAAPTARQRWFFFAAGQKELAVTSELVNGHHMGTSWLISAHRTLGIVGLIVFLAVTIIQMIDMADVAFYRAVLLLVAAHSVGASLGVFGTVPKYWPWIIFLFSLAGASIALIAVICEIARQSRCGAPIGVYETSICTTSGWLGYVVPVEASLIFLLTFLSTIFAVWSLATARRLRLKIKPGDSTPAASTD